MDPLNLYVGSAGSKGGLKLISNFGRPESEIIEILKGKKKIRKNQSKKIKIQKN